MTEQSKMAQEIKDAFKVEIQKIKNTAKTDIDAIKNSLSKLKAQVEVSAGVTHSVRNEPSFRIGGGSFLLASGVEIPSGGSGRITYDYVWVGAKKVTPPAKTTNFLKIYLDGSGCSWVEAMPNTQDENAVVIDVTKNRIYIHGAFGGAT